MLKALGNLKPLHAPAFLLAMCLLCAFNAFSLTTADPDLWGHIKFGESAWQEGALPSEENYSYTAPGHRWINHEWLTEILFYKIFSIFGSGGLLVMKMLIGLFIVERLARLAFVKDKPRRNSACLIIIVLLTFILAPGFMPRPHLMTYIGIALLTLSLGKAFQGNEKALIYIPIIFLFWVNMHGGVVAGLAIACVALGYGVVEKIRTDQAPGLWIATLAATIAICLVNPYGYHLWNFFAQTLSVPRNITEWNGIPFDTMHFWQFKLYTILFIGLWLFDKKKWGWQVWVIAPAIYFAFKHQRHIPLAAILMAPYLIARISELAETKFRLYTASIHLHNGLLVGMLLFAGSQLGIGLMKNASAQFKLLAPPQTYPVYAARFMHSNDISGNLWNPLDWGEYLIWKTPGSRVSVDGRFRTAYPEEVIQDHFDFASGQPGWQALLEKYPTELVLARKRDGTHLRMNQLPGWVKIYEDLICVLYVKNDPRLALWERMKKGPFIRDESLPDFHFP
ncbi:MAG: hypothetical protein G3M78_03815 [Candidatus Nitrohelix vancouverensis]|uniref:Glycosyltransferase RgtA/B/C/D-like domain-containing protein n=1 Tax=Candidatus Nitrohelix vancouverensis TaxID=2705534 RepID=A0A7T0C128_9BACT|nr:MAG: hypothetical protein G3M78_03815 [Candidatus Nitrohelix vancouverensis]